MADKQKFEKGDTVKLKSGSPLMTVQDTENAFGSRSITCLYFDEENQPITVGNLDDAMLVQSESNEGKAFPISGGNSKK